MNRFLAVCTFLLIMFWSASSAQNHRTNESPEGGVYLFGGSGNELLERCSHPTVRVGDTMPVTELVKEARDNGMCLGYIIGVSDQILADQPSGNTKRSYCLAADVRSEQLFMVVKKYLEDNPAVLHFPAAVLTERALREAFPCR
jgi:hypothetical protein